MPDLGAALAAEGDPRLAVGDGGGAQRVCPDEIALDDVVRTGHRYPAAAVARDHVALPRSMPAHQRADVAEQIDPVRVVEDRQRSRDVRTDPVALDLDVRPGHGADLYAESLVR